MRVPVVSTYRFVLVIGACILACSLAIRAQPTTQIPQGRVESPAEGNVRVTRVRAFIKDGRVHAFVQATLPDGCTSLQSVKQKRTDTTIDITLTSVRQGEVCIMIVQDLNEWIRLDGAFQPGEYTVRANRIPVRFRLVRAAGGTLRVDPDPGPLPRPPYEQEIRR